MTLHFYKKNKEKHTKPDLLQRKGINRKRNTQQEKECN